MTVACWNILGLILSLFGVLLLFSLTPACADPRGRNMSQIKPLNIGRCFCFLSDTECRIGCEPAELAPLLHKERTRRRVRKSVATLFWAG